MAKKAARRTSRVDLSKLTSAQLERELARRRKGQVQELRRKRQELLKQVEAVDQQIAELEAELPGRRKPTKKTAKAEPKADTRTRQTRARRSSVAVKRLESRVLKAVQSAKAPMGIAEIAAKAKMGKESIALPLRKLLAAGKVVKRGERRLTKYSAK